MLLAARRRGGNRTRTIAGAGNLKSVAVTPRLHPHGPQGVDRPHTAGRVPELSDSAPSIIAMTEESTHEGQLHVDGEGAANG